MQDRLAPLIALVLAHLLADFPLQRTAVVTGKRARKIGAFVEHMVVHGALAVAALLLFAPDMPSRALWTTIAVVVLGHLALDMAKTEALVRRPSLDTWPLFLGDQVLHLCLIVCAATICAGVPLDLADFLPARRFLAAHLSAATVFVTVVFPTGYLIRYLLAPWGDELDRNHGEPRDGGHLGVDKGLTNAGLFLGWLERALLLFAFSEESFTAVGLILGAKSIVRFPEFKSRAFAEYFLIGNLLSVGAAALGGVVLNRLSGE